MDSVEAVEGWRKKHQNIAQRKPASRMDAKTSPHGQVVQPTAHPDYGRVTDDFRDSIRANEVRQDGGDLGEDHQAARTRHEIAKANLAEMREAEERGDLIRVVAGKSTLAAVFSTTRDALLQLPARLAPIIAADPDTASVQNTLHAEIHQALHYLAGAEARVGQTESALE